MAKLYLDDFRVPKDVSWDVVTGYDEFVDYIGRKGLPDVISFDHDLVDKHYNGYSESDVERTGYDAAKWLTDNYDCSKLEVIVHSWNRVGATRIASLFPCATVKTANPKEFTTSFW